MALCYNFTRVLNILGFERFVACIAKALALPKHALAAALDRVQLILQAFTLLFVPPREVRQLRPAPVGRKPFLPGLDGLCGRCPVQPHLQKYFPSQLPQINSTTPPVSSHSRGVSRSSRTRGGMRWTRQRWARWDRRAGFTCERSPSALTNGASCGRRSRVVLTPRRRRQVQRRRCRPDRARTTP
jgi:hypothetical protein